MYPQLFKTLKFVFLGCFWRCPRTFGQQNESKHSHKDKPWLRDEETWGVPPLDRADEALAKADESNDDVICCRGAEPLEAPDDDLDDWMRSSFAATNSAWATSCGLWGWNLNKLSCEYNNIITQTEPICYLYNHCRLNSCSNLGLVPWSSCY